MASAGIIMYSSGASTRKPLYVDSRNVYPEREERNFGLVIQVPKQQLQVTDDAITPREEGNISEENDSDSSGGSGYDTDIDLKNDRKLRQKPKARDDIQAYEDACRVLDTVSQSRILHGLSNDILNICHRHIGPIGAKALCMALVHNIHIEELNIEDNGLGPVGSKYISEMLLDNDTIQILNLSYNDMGTEGAFAIGEAMKFNKGLLNLNISANHFADWDSEYLAGGIQGNESIKELNLSHNGLSIRGGTAIGLAMAINFTIKKLDLSWNQIREKGAVALCKGLQENYSLTHLDLSFNGMGYEGSLALGNLLKTNTIIKEVDISHNRITWKAVPLLCKGLSVNETLQVLKVGWNPLTTTGCIDLLEAISGENSGLQELDMEGVCVIGEYEMLATAIKQNRDFIYKHGGIVASHDVLGERHEKKLTPMQRVINYMKRTGIRPTELFRTMDKQVNKHISHDEMIVRLKKAGIDMASYEVQELLDQLERNASFTGGEGNVNYKNVSRSVQDQLLQDRFEKIKLRENEKRLKQYHKDIMKRGSLPPIYDTSEPGDSKLFAPSEANMSIGLGSYSRMSMDSRKGLHSSGLKRSNSATGGPDPSDFGRPAVGRNSPTAGSAIQRSLSNDRKANRSLSMQTSLYDLAQSVDPNSITKAKPGKILSMSKPLGSKPIAFGTGGKKKKKKKKKTKKK